MKTAVITGASRGIGKAVAIKLAELGYQLVLIAQHQENLQKTASELQHQFNFTPEQKPLLIPLDVANEEAVNQAVNQIINQYGSIDVLFNGAGILTHGTTKMTPVELEKLLKINVVGTFNFVHAIAPYMKQQQSGYIFNVASRLGKIASANDGGYSASKFAVVGLSEALFRELAPFNVKVTALCPSFVDTDMVRGVSSIMTSADMIQPNDIAETVAYLLRLSPTAFIQDILIQCKKLVG